MSEDRQWFNVGAVKLPEAHRDVAASVFGQHPGRFRDVIGADTPEDDERFPVGSHTAYSAYLTEREAERFSRASNCRHIAPDQRHDNVTGYSPYLPRPNAQRYLQGEVDVYPTLTGVGVPIGVIDEGTTYAARVEKNINLGNRAMFLLGGQPSGEIFPTYVHGCLCMGNAVPANGTLIDAFTIGNDSTYDSDVAAAITWVVGQGARLVNMSFTLNGYSEIINDAFVTAQSSDVVFYVAAGNNGQRIQRWPASANTYINYVYSIMSIDMSLGQASSFTNYGPWHTGTAPGELVYTTDYDGTVVQWAGTSAATPHTLQLAARIMSANVSARQAAAALAQTTRDLGLGEDQGGHPVGGLFSMQAALRWLNKEPAVAITRQVNPQRDAALPLW